eukprot:m.75785 g.75785  ORF g.75785 m.75785 type:complete len:70 (-) comp12460_c0_seq1:1222-1431(-)
MSSTTVAQIEHGASRRLLTSATKQQAQRPNVAAQTAARQGSRIVTQLAVAGSSMAGVLGLGYVGGMSSV